MPTTSQTDLSLLDVDSSNHTLYNKTPTQIIEWVAEHAVKPIITTNFRPNTAAILHLVTQVIPDIPVLWIDSGYNTEPTLAYADRVTELLNLNLIIRKPEESEILEKFQKTGIPSLDDPAHAEFSHLVKIAPFAKGLEELKPDTWITGIRKEQTEFRKSLGVLSHSKQGILKVAPIFYWSEKEQLEYIAKHNLPNETRYFDPTKAEEHRECGIQLL